MAAIVICFGVTAMLAAIRSLFRWVLATAANGSPAEQQIEAIKRFTVFVEESRFKLWRPGDEIPDAETRLLIRVATYSKPDFGTLEVFLAYW
jgi:hypothetical protein